MLLRIRTCLCHPKLIGTFFKDKAWKVLLIVLSIFICYLGVVLAYGLNHDFFGVSDNRYITQMVIECPKIDVTYNDETNKITGESVAISRNTQQNYYTICFLPQEEVSLSRYFTIVFQADAATTYYGSFKLTTLKYSDMKEIDSFTLEGVKKGTTEDTIAFEYMINRILDSVNFNYGLFYFINYAIRALFLYLVIVLVAYFSSKMYNPTIERNVRLKLSLYASVVFFLIMIFGVLFNADWILWIAFIIPVIYSIKTFTHIIKKKNI